MYYIVVCCPEKWVAWDNLHAYSTSHPDSRLSHTLDAIAPTTRTTLGLACLSPTPLLGSCIHNFSDTTPLRPFSQISQFPFIPSTTNSSVDDGGVCCGRDTINLMNEPGSSKPLNIPNYDGGVLCLSDSLLGPSAPPRSLDHRLQVCGGMQHHVHLPTASNITRSQKAFPITVILSQSQKAFPVSQSQKAFPISRTSFSPRISSCPQQNHLAGHCYFIFLRALKSRFS